MIFYTCGCIYVEAIGMNTANRFDLPQGTLDLLIMRIVALGPIHGYAIAQRIQQMSREALQVQHGSLYPAVHRLEYKKILDATWKASETGREAKFYELTARGRGRRRRYRYQLRSTTRLHPDRECWSPHSGGSE